MKIVLIIFSLLVCKASAQDGYFWHLTDFHLDTSYWTNKENARDASEFFTGGSYDVTKCWLEGGGQFGDYNCDSPMALIRSAIEFVQKETRQLNLPQNTFVIWTGDDTVHTKDSHFSLDIVVDLISENTKAIKPLFDTSLMRIYPVLGNHDAFPKSQFPSKPQENDLYHRVADLWDGILFPSSKNQFEKNGGYYLVNKTESQLPFHLIGLNTNVYYQNNNLTAADELDPLGQFAWLKDVLTDCQNKDEKAFVFAHICPGKFERYYEQPDKEYSGFHWFRPDLNDKFIDEIILPFNQTIIAQFYGHHHTDTFKLFNSGDEIVSGAFLSPAITPWRSTLSTETGSNNPGLRLVKYDQKTGELKEITTYWLNLKEANKNGLPDWKVLYDFASFYNLKDLSASSLGELAKSLKPGVNETTFSQYYRFNSVNYDEYVEYNCSESCKQTQYCSIIRQRYQEFEDCFNELNSGSEIHFINKLFLLGLASLFYKMM